MIWDANFTRPVLTRHAPPAAAARAARATCCLIRFHTRTSPPLSRAQRNGARRRAGGVCGGTGVAVPPLAGSARVTHDTHAHSLLHALHDRCTRPRMTPLDDHLHSRSRRCPRPPPAPRLYSLGHSLRHDTLHANRLSTARCELIRYNFYTCGSVHFRA